MDMYYHICLLLLPPTLSVQGNDVADPCMYKKSLSLEPSRWFLQWSIYFIVGMNESLSNTEAVFSLEYFFEYFQKRHDTIYSYGQKPS